MKSIGVMTRWAGLVPQGGLVAFELAPFPAGSPQRMAAKLSPQKCNKSHMFTLELVRTCAGSGFAMMSMSRLCRSCAGLVGLLRNGRTKRRAVTFHDNTSFQTTLRRALARARFRRGRGKQSPEFVDDKYQ